MHLFETFLTLIGTLKSDKGTAAILGEMEKFCTQEVIISSRHENYCSCRREWGTLDVWEHRAAFNFFFMPKAILPWLILKIFLDEHLTQKVLGGLDETCRFCDEFSFFLQKSNFLKFQLQFNMSLLFDIEISLSYVKSAMTTTLQFDISFLTWHYMRSLWQRKFVKKSGQGTISNSS